jgi:hypothetical protein
LADAQWISFSVNATHGLRRSAEDKANAVRGALRHPTGQALSDQKLAAHVGVSDKTVAKYRAELAATSEIPKSTSRTGRDGRTINTSKIGKKRRKPSREVKKMLAMLPENIRSAVASSSIGNNIGKITKLACMSEEEQQAALVELLSSDVNEVLGVSNADVDKATQILKHGSPEVIAAVEAGNMELDEALATIDDAEPALCPRCGSTCFPDGTCRACIAEAPVDDEPANEDDDQVDRRRHREALATLFDAGNQFGRCVYLATIALDVEPREEHPVHVACRALDALLKWAKDEHQKLQEAVA